MVQYYNLSEFGETEGFISFTQKLSELSHYAFGYMLLVVTFAIPLMYMLKNNEDVVKAINVSSLYTTLLSIFFYVAGIILRGEIVFLCALVYIITASVRWFHKD
jgi:ABC-type multidrug transport system permease subunit